MPKRAEIVCVPVDDVESPPGSQHASSHVGDEVAFVDGGVGPSVRG